MRKCCMPAYMPDDLDLCLYAAAPYAGSHEMEEFEEARHSVISEQSTVSKQSAVTKRREKRIFRKIQRSIRYAEKHAHYHPVWEMAKRVSVIVLLILSVSFLGALQVEAVRQEIYHAVVEAFGIEWFDEKLGIQFVSVTEDVPTQILDYKEPVMDTTYTQNVIRKDGTGFLVEYESADSLIAYTQKLLTDYASLLSNRDTQVEDIQVQDLSGIKVTYTIEETTMTNIIWKDEKYAYSISGNLTYAELLVIAESVQ